MIRLAILWHQHQPCYFDMWRGESAMPWVRMHGIKDYWGMPAILREFPGVHAHINLVPGLILQIEAAAAGAGDPWLRLARIPAEDLRPEEMQAILETFFMANEQSLINANARYGEIRRKARGPSGWRPSALTIEDWRDLQVWQTLAWFHPLLRDTLPAVRALYAKGKGFSEADKEALFAAQRGVLSGLIPAHRTMQDTGQIEITTTPFWHPIVPLLARMESARVAMPDVALPRAPSLDMADDARTQLARAVALHRDRFGVDPRGLWPSEGSVSPEAAALFEEAGFRWFATDEGVLESSINSDFRRGPNGVPARPRELYTPWKVTDRLSAVFRDHGLSDLVGFEYKHADPDEAAEDLVARIRRSGREAGPDALVTLALDGENAWEHYPGNGVAFLRAFYRRIQDAKDIVTVRLGEHLEAHPPERRISRLWSGSWIDRNFKIWVGHPEDNTAWELLGRTRAMLLEATRAAGRDPRRDGPPATLSSSSSANSESRALDWAWESLLAAEGSDWFWWFGEEHFSALAGTFDSIFRSHLQNVYRFLGQPVPASLLRPIKGKSAPEPSWTPPWAFLDVKIDGRRSEYYEWISAGHYAAAKDLDVMDRSAAWIQDVWFGFDRRNLFVRVDVDGRALEGLVTRSVTISFAQPEGMSVTVSAGGKAAGCGARAAAAEILEVAIPLQELGSGPGEMIEFTVEARSGPAVQRVPGRLPISIRVPREEDEKVKWNA